MEGHSIKDYIEVTLIAYAFIAFVLWLVLQASYPGVLFYGVLFIFAPFVAIVIHVIADHLSETRSHYPHLTKGCGDD